VSSHEMDFTMNVCHKKKRCSGNLTYKNDHSHKLITNLQNKCLMQITILCVVITKGSNLIV
jgi:hypothetical protein